MTKFLIGFSYAFILITSLCLSSACMAANSVTTYEYDSRGRLTQAKDDQNKEVNYTYDDAGNRTKVGDGVVVPVAEPTITSFSAPTRVTTSGATVLISWASTDTTHCALVLSANAGNYPNVAPTGAQSVRIYQTTTATITCYQGAKSATSSRTIRLVNRD